MFDFTKEEYDHIKEKAMLNDELSEILEMKIKRYTNVEIQMKLNLTEATLSRRIKILKKKIKKVL